MAVESWKCKVFEITTVLRQGQAPDVKSKLIKTFTVSERTVDRRRKKAMAEAKCYAGNRPYSCNVGDGTIVVNIRNTIQK